MKIGIMQPYIFPYIGYFQLIGAVDQFVVYDNIKYTKKGWINRNRILCNGKDEYVSIPLKKDSDFLNVDQRYLADTWAQEQHKFLNKIKECYRKAPFFTDAFEVVQQCISYEDRNLFNYIYHSIKVLCNYLSITTPLVISSSVAIDHELAAEQKVLALCKALHADTYINPIGGIELYDKTFFKQEGIDLFFLKTGTVEYKQFNHEFIPFLSIIDVMMFNDRDAIKNMLNNYGLL